MQPNKQQGEMKNYQATPEKVQRNKTQLRNTLLLVLGATIWGLAFVAQSVGSDYVGAYTFLAARSWLACAFLMTWILVRYAGECRRQMQTGTVCIAQENADKMAAEHAAKAGQRCSSVSARPALWKNPKQLILGGIFCGVFLFSASAAQQMGIGNTDTTAKAGFVTALYVVLVPIMQTLGGRKKGLHLWLCVVVSLAGLYLLCLAGKEELRFTGGEWQLLLCALLFTFQILSVDRYSPLVDVIQLSFAEFLVTAVLATIGMLWRETPDWQAVKAAGIAIAYCGFLSSGVAYTLQIIGQRDLDPTIASLAMCLESVFSALGGFVILHQHLMPQELLGCVLMFAAIVGAQFPGRQA